MDLEGKLNEVERSYRDLEERLSDPGVASNPLEVSKLAKRYAELGHVVSKYREYKGVVSKLRQAREILESESDEEMRQLAHEELRALEPQLEELEAQIKLLLLPKDPNDNRNVIVEIRAGAGGEEASLFAAVLFRMYMRYAERKGWTTEM
ncbi:MAG TPA: PCRF domain-containing protein, partial [Thermosynergistes sp.]|nr:PCRF domain-containing protein [Thermosynergistes sp.]